MSCPKLPDQTNLPSAVRRYPLSWATLATWQACLTRTGLFFFSVASLRGFDSYLGDGTFEIKKPKRIWEAHKKKLSKRKNEDPAHQYYFWNLHLCFRYLHDISGPYYNLKGPRVFFFRIIRLTCFVPNFCLWLGFRRRFWGGGSDRFFFYFSWPSKKDHVSISVKLARSK